MYRRTTATAPRGACAVYHRYQHNMARMVRMLAHRCAHPRTAIAIWRMDGSLTNSETARRRKASYNSAVRYLYRARRLYRCGRRHIFRRGGWLARLGRRRAGLDAHACAANLPSMLLSIRWIGRRPYLILAARRLADDAICNSAFLAALGGRAANAGFNLLRHRKQTGRVRAA